MRCWPPIVISYNLGYQSLLKDLKESTKQRFGAIEFQYPMADVEAKIISHESGVNDNITKTLVHIAEQSRNLKGHGLDEGASTRMLIHIGKLISSDVAKLVHPLYTRLNIISAQPLEDIVATVTEAYNTNRNCRLAGIQNHG